MFDTLFGGGQYAIKLLFAFIVVFGLLALALWLVRRFSGERIGGGGTRARQPRLAVIDAATVDSRRRLVLIRRDNVEHLMMIGGPTDVVIKSNIVRAAAAQRETVISRTQPAAEALPRPVPPGEGTTWPLQPESTPRSAEKSEPPSRAEPPMRAQRPAPPTLEYTPQWSGPEPEAAPSPPALPRERRLRGDPLAGLAEELGRVPSPPEPARFEPPPRSAPRREPRAPRSQPAPPAPTPPAAIPDARFTSPADQNLAEMAQRLEAALRRPAKGDEARTPAAPPTTEPTGEERRDVSAPAESALHRPAAPTEAAPPGRSEPKPARTDGKIPPAKSLYDSLEQEMASLLGRPDGKN